MKSIYVAVVALALSAGAARAEESVQAPVKQGAPERLLEPRLGVYVPTGKLGASPSVAVEGGVPWDVKRNIWLVAELGYARPTMTNRVLGAPIGGDFHYRLATNDFGLFLGARKNFEAPFQKRLPRLQPFAEAGLKLHLLYTQVSGASESLGGFGRNHESTLVFGLAARGGAAYRLGPGALSLAFELGYARFTQTITGKSNVFNLTPSLGYAWFF